MPLSNVWVSASPPPTLPLPPPPPSLPHPGGILDVPCPMLTLMLEEPPQWEEEEEEEEVVVEEEGLEVEMVLRRH